MTEQEWINLYLLRTSPSPRLPLPAADYERAPRVMFYARRAWHFFGWEAGVLCSKAPLEELFEGDYVYRRRFGIEIRSGLWRYLRGVVRIVR
jgi:hypothetical protein